MGCATVVIIFLILVFLGYWIENPVEGTAFFVAVLVIAILSHIYSNEQKKKEIKRQQELIDAELKRREEKERAWEFQIRSGNLPVNAALREENRSNYFVNMRISGKNENTVDLTSTKFGDSMDALMFARWLRNTLHCECFVRKSEGTRSYVVIANAVYPAQLKDYIGAERNVLEFKNPVFGVDDYSNISSAQQLEDEIISQYSNGVEYEKYIATILKQQGFVNVSLTPASGDYGADILAVYNGVKVCIQCKFYSGAVGIAAVQEIIGAKSHYKCDAAAVITNSTFTSAAKQLASESGVQLCENIT